VAPFDVVADGCDVVVVTVVFAVVLDVTVLVSVFVWDVVVARPVVVLVSVPADA